MSRDAFTVGYAKVYDEGLEHPAPTNPNTKLGRRDDYEGGWIWRTPQEAATFLKSSAFAHAFPGRDPNEFAVYRLELPTGWDADVSVEPHTSDGVHRLLHDALIVSKV
jgi:hypothetical protein